MHNLYPRAHPDCPVHHGRHVTSHPQLWPTPNTPSGGPNYRSTAKHTGGLDLDGKAAMWTTPQAHDQAGGNPQRVRRKGTTHGCANLADDVTAWRADS